MTRRILSVVLLCALAFVPACVVVDPTPTTRPTSQPYADNPTVRWYLSQYDFWLNRADVLATVAAGPNAKPKDFEDWENAKKWAVWFRESLELWGVATKG